MPRVGLDQDGVGDDGRDLHDRDVQRTAEPGVGLFQARRRVVGAGRVDEYDRGRPAMGQLSHLAPDRPVPLGRLLIPQGLAEVVNGRVAEQQCRPTGEIGVLVEALVAGRPALDGVPHERDRCDQLAVA